MILSFIVCMVILVLSVLVYLKTDVNQILLTDISNNHKSKVVIDFQYDKNCQPYNRLTSNAFYQGTIGGCNCPHTLKRGSCSEEKNKSCTNVYRTSPIELNIWRDSSICLVRQVETYHTSVRYSDLWKFAVPKGENCKKGFKACGYLDTVQNIICVDAFSACPITRVEVSDKPFFKSKTKNKTDDDKKESKSSVKSLVEPKGDAQVLIQNDIKTLRLDHDTFLVFSNDPNYTENPIPVEFKVFEEAPCAFSSEYMKNPKGDYKLDDNSEYNYVKNCSVLYSKRVHENPSKRYHPGIFYMDLKKEETFLSHPTEDKGKDNSKMFIENSKDFKGYQVDTRYNLIDTLSKESFYRENNVLSIVRALPNYSVDNLHYIDINLYSRSFIGIKKSCSDSYASPEHLDYFLQVSQSIYWKVIVLISMSSFLFLFTVISVCQYEDLARFFTYLSCTLAIAAFIYFFLNNFIHIYIDERIYNCVDDIFAETLGIIEENSNKMFSFLLKICSLVLLLVGLLVAFTITILLMGSEGRRSVMPEQEIFVDDKSTSYFSYHKLSTKDDGEGESKNRSKLASGSNRSNKSNPSKPSNPSKSNKTGVDK